MKKIVKLSFIFFSIATIILALGCEDSQKDKAWEAKNKEKIEAYLASTNGTLKYDSIQVKKADNSLTLTNVNGTLRVVGPNKKFSGVTNYFIKEVTAIGVPFGDEKTEGILTLGKKVIIKGLSTTTVASIERPGNNYDTFRTKANAVYDSVTLTDIVIDGPTFKKIISTGVFSLSDIAKLETFRASSSKIKGYKQDISSKFGMPFQITSEEITSKLISFTETNDYLLKNPKVWENGKVVVAADTVAFKNFSAQGIFKAIIQENPQKIVKDLIKQNLEFDGLSASNIVFGQEKELIKIKNISFDFTKKDIFNNLFTKLSIESLQIPIQLIENKSTSIFGSGLSISSIYNNPIDISVNFAIDAKKEGNDFVINVKNYDIKENNLGGISQSSKFFIPNVEFDEKTNLPKNFEKIVFSKGNLSIEDKGLLNVIFGIAAQVINQNSASATRAMASLTLGSQCNSFGPLAVDLCKGLTAILNEPGRLDIAIEPKEPIPLMEYSNKIMNLNSKDIGLTWKFTKK